MYSQTICYTVNVAANLATSSLEALQIAEPWLAAALVWNCYLHLSKDLISK